MSSSPQPKLPPTPCCSFHPGLQSWPLQSTSEGLVRAQACPSPPPNRPWLPSALRTRSRPLACQLCTSPHSPHSKLHSSFRPQTQCPLFQEALPDASAGSDGPLRPPPTSALPTLGHHCLGMRLCSSPDCEPPVGRGKAVSVTTVSPAPRAGIREMKG